MPKGPGSYHGGPKKGKAHVRKGTKKGGKKK